MTAPNLFKEDFGQRRYDLAGFLLARQGSNRPALSDRRNIPGVYSVAHALKPSHLSPTVEGVLLVLVTAATCFLSYEAIRRVRLLRPL